MKIFRGIKISLTVDTSFLRLSDNKNPDRGFISPFVRINHKRFITLKLSTLFVYFSVSLDLYEKEGSGSTISRITKVTNPFSSDDQKTQGCNSVCTGRQGKQSNSRLLKIKTHTDRCFMLCVCVRALLSRYHIYMMQIL